MAVPHMRWERPPPRHGLVCPSCSTFVLSLCLSRERVNKRRVKEMVKEFTLLCRGLHGTEYTADY